MIANKTGRWAAAILGAGWFAFGSVGRGEVLNDARPAPARSVELGQPAPEFELPDETGKVHRLSGYRGKTVVLMFYPKDFTPG